MRGEKKSYKKESMKETFKIKNFFLLRFAVSWWELLITIPNTISKNLFKLFLRILCYIYTHTQNIYSSSNLLLYEVYRRIIVGVTNKALWRNLVINRKKKNKRNVNEVDTSSRTAPTTFNGIFYVKNDLYLINNHKNPTVSKKKKSIFSRYANID